MKRIIEIAALENSAHRNQVGTFSSIPDGWAEIPDGIEIPSTFPFVGLEIDEGTGKVSAMTDGTVPETTEEEEPSIEERMDVTEEAVQEIMEVLFSV